uniref:NudE neurodevelopment protein 1 like 1 n=1 Tax=Gorilla gorilla gorilla TaxID=9595 RepID=A0A2I2ZVF6_GORGO
MDGEDIPDFSSLKEETAYWKELSLKYKQSRWGHLWPVLHALILPHHFGHLEILISCLGLHRTDFTFSSASRKLGMS